MLKFFKNKLCHQGRQDPSSNHLQPSTKNNQTNPSVILVKVKELFKKGYHLHFLQPIDKHLNDYPPFGNRKHQVIKIEDEHYFKWVFSNPLDDESKRKLAGFLGIEITDIIEETFDNHQKRFYPY